MSTVILPVKNQNSVIFVSFDFISSLIAGETLTSASVVATVASGEDATPSAIVSGAATITGLVVNQKIIDGVVGVIYLLSCACMTSLGNSIVLRGTLAVVDNNPYQS